MVKYSGGKIPKNKPGSFISYSTKANLKLLSVLSTTYFKKIIMNLFKLLDHEPEPININPAPQHCPLASLESLLGQKLEREKSMESYVF